MNAGAPARRRGGDPPLPDDLRQFVETQGFVPGNSVEVIGVGGAGDRLLSVGDTTSHFAVDLVSGIVVSAR